MISKGIRESEANVLLSEFKPRSSETLPFLTKTSLQNGHQGKGRSYKARLPLQNACKSIVEWESTTTFNKIQILPCAKQMSR